MTNDLEQRVNDAINLLSPITIHNPSDTYSVTGDQMDLLRALIQDQQVEIQRLQANQVRLRPIDELEKDKLVLAYNPESELYLYVEKKNENLLTQYQVYLEKDDFSASEFSGFIQLEDLPREVTE